RDLIVTGVQTCALPISVGHSEGRDAPHTAIRSSASPVAVVSAQLKPGRANQLTVLEEIIQLHPSMVAGDLLPLGHRGSPQEQERSEERRVGKQGERSGA